MTATDASNSLVKTSPSSRLLPGPALPATTRTAVAVTVIAVASDALLRHGAASVAVVLLTTVIGLGLWWAGALRTRNSRALVAIAVVFAALVGVRVSAWVVPLNLAAAAGLLLAAVSFSGEARLADVGPRAVLVRMLRLAASAARGPSWVGRSLQPLVSTGRGNVVPVLRGLVLALPILATLLALLAWGDAVFAQLFDVEIDVARIAGHVAVIGIAWLAAAMMVAEAAAPDPDSGTQTRRSQGSIEATMLLGGLVVLFGAFTATNLVALFGGADHVLATTGLTRAEYARSGFFQLQAVAALTLLVLSTLRSVVHPEEPGTVRRLRRLTYAAIVLTLAIVAVSIGRLLLYVDAFGLSMLRLYTMVFAAWTGVIFLALAAAVAGFAARKHWLLPFAAGSGLAVLLALNMVNAEAQVARYNIANAERLGRLDASYLSRELSVDAVPTVVAMRDELSATHRDDVAALLCDRAARADREARADRGDRRAGLLAFNLSRARAAAALTAICD